MILLQVFILLIAERTHGKRISLILVDQAQEISIGDLVPVMQLPVNRLVFFGDRNQSRFWRPKHTIVRNTDLFRQSAFERMIAACPQKAFYLKTQWRLPSPLDGIVNVMFYGGLVTFKLGRDSIVILLR